MSADELDVIARKHEALRNELTESVELIGGAGLAFPEETTVVRLGSDERAARPRPLAPLRGPARRSGR